MRKKNYLALGQLILFLCILLILTKFSPLLPFDGDDWRYVGGVRQPIPLWGVWNPTRVLPEVLMPIGGMIGAFLVYPITKDYVGSLAFAEGFIEAVFVFAVLYYFYKVLIKRIRLSKWPAFICEIFFFLSFFFLFKRFNIPSYSGFWAADLTCVFYYIIPGLLNLAIILYMLQVKDFVQFFNKSSNIKKGIFFALLYFTIFSNTQLNIIIASFCFIKCLPIIYQSFKEKSFNAFIKNSWIYIAILILWSMTVVFDLNGKRAKYVSDVNNGSFLVNLLRTLQQFINFVKEQNLPIAGLLTLTLISTLLIAVNTTIKKKRNRALSFEYIKMEFYIIFSCFCSLIYLILAYTKAGSTYASRPDAMWAVISLFLLGVNLAVAYFMKIVPITISSLPLLCILLAIFSFNMNERPIYAANASYDSYTIKKVDNYIINQIISADRKGKASVVVKVPQDSEDSSPKVTTSNWPHPYNMAIWLQNTLYSHHIIRSRIHIVFKPDKKVNEKFYENKSEEQPFFPPE